MPDSTPDRPHWSHDPAAYRRSVLRALRHPDTYVEAAFAILIMLSATGLGLMLAARVREMLS